MKIRALATTCALIAGLAASSAFAGSFTASTVSRGALIQTVGCSPNDDDKQGKCMQECDDTWIKASQAYHSDIPAAKEAKKACDAKCGCEAK